jgi:hypothetical protein
MPDKLLGRFLNDLRNHASDHVAIAMDVQEYCQSRGIPTTRRLSEDEQKDILRVIFQRLTERVMTPDSR